MESVYDGESLLSLAFCYYSTRLNDIRDLLPRRPMSDQNLMQQPIMVAG